MADPAASDCFALALAALSDRRARFVEEYLVDAVGAAAATRAGYAAGSAHVTASRLLRDAKVQAAIAAGRAARSVRLRITADQVVLELARLAFADPRKAVSWGAGTVALVDSPTLDDDTAAAIARVAMTEAGPSIAFHAKLPAIQLLMRHLGLLREREDDLAADAAAVVAILEEARKRVEAARPPAATGLERPPLTRRDTGGDDA